MKIGPISWHLVTVDSAGVPSGGFFGDVEFFRDEALRHGLHLAWSRLHHCFAILTRRGPQKWVFQRLFHNEQTRCAIPLTRDLLSLMIRLWEAFCRDSSHERLSDVQDRLKKEREVEVSDELREGSELIREDVIRAVKLRRGYSTTNFLSLPEGRVGVK